MHTYRTISDNESIALDLAVTYLLACKDLSLEWCAGQDLDGYINKGYEGVGYGSITYIENAQIVAGKRILNALSSVCRKLEKNEALPADWFETM